MAGLDYRKVYILGNTYYLFRYKIGIAKNMKNRERQIEETLKGDTYEIFSIRLIYAEKVETFLHRIYRLQRTKLRGSGKTDWFWFLLPVTPILLLCVVFLLQIASFLLLFYCMIILLLNSGA